MIRLGTIAKFLALNAHTSETMAAMGLQTFCKYFNILLHMLAENFTHAVLISCMKCVLVELMVAWYNLAETS